MLPTLSGPIRKPASGAAPRQLAILLHGLGADGNDLIGLAPYWAPLFPEAEFVAPDAPFPCDMAPFGRQWFSLQDRSPMSILAGVRAAAPILDAYIDDALKARNLDESRLALVGFSQGTMMSLYVGLRRAKGAGPSAPASAPRRAGARSSRPQRSGAGAPRLRECGKCRDRAVRHRHAARRRRGRSRRQSRRACRSRDR